MYDGLFFVLRIAAALLMGTAIGLERQIRQHSAGLRTNALVCVGAALFVSLSRMIDHEASPTRIAAQVVSGIGFLGGGVILREGFTVRGMNTAATLWCSAAVGTLAGSGFVLHAAVGTLAVLFVHLGLRPIVRIVDARSKHLQDVDSLYRVRVVCQEQTEGVIRLILLRHVNSGPSMSMQGISRQDTDKPDQTAVVAEVYSTGRNDKYFNDLVSRISIEPSVSSVSWERVQ
jgi:putative Mg2+ transporter-C (MgtC) family protein